MKELLSDRDIGILKAYAKCDMRMNRTADMVHYTTRFLYIVFGEIFQKTGKDPHSFWDLFDIMRALEEEGAVGRED